MLAPPYGERQTASLQLGFLMLQHVSKAFCVQSLHPDVGQPVIWEMQFAFSQLSTHDVFPVLR